MDDADFSEEELDAALRGARRVGGVPASTVTPKKEKWKSAKISLSSKASGVSRASAKTGQP